MKAIYSLLVVTILVGSFMCAACSSDEPFIQPSVTAIEMEGEGGEIEVSLNDIEWSIAGVLNKQNHYDVNIFGVAYSTEGEIIRDNQQLHLNGLGKLEALWGDKGLQIVRETPSSFKLIVEENLTEEDFNFSVLLQSGNETREVIVYQSKSQGYEIENIEYSIKPEDKDSLYLATTSMSYSFSVPNSLSGVTINPLENEKSRTYFTGTTAENIFSWLEKSPFEVKIPNSHHNNKVYYNNETSLFARYVTESSLPNYLNQSLVLDVPAGKNQLFVEAEYLKQQFSYTLTLINNRTQQKKTIEGKFVRIDPTGTLHKNWKALEE